MTILMQFSKIKCIFYDSFRESAPLGAEKEREQCRPVSLYDCLSFLLSIMSVFAFIFALIFISFICSSSAFSSSLLFVRSACVSKFIFLFVSTVNLMCLWHVLTVSSWRGYRRGYWRFMLTFFLLYRIYTIPWVSSLLTHLCLGKRPLTVFVLSMHDPDWKANCAAHSTLANKERTTEIQCLLLWQVGGLVRNDHVNRCIVSLAINKIRVSRA